MALPQAWRAAKTALSRRKRTHVRRRGGRKASEEQQPPVGASPARSGKFVSPSTRLCRRPHACGGICSRAVTAVTSAVARRSVRPLTAAARAAGGPARRQRPALLLDGRARAGSDRPTGRRPAPRSRSPRPWPPRPRCRPRRRRSPSTRQHPRPPRATRRRASPPSGTTRVLTSTVTSWKTSIGMS